LLIAEGMVMLKNQRDLLPFPRGKRILLAGTALLNGGGSGDSAAFGYFAPNHKGEGLHNGGLVAQRLMAGTLSRALHATVEWDYETRKSVSSFDLVIAFGAQFRSEAYLVDSQDGFFHIDQCDSMLNATTYGQCDYAGEFLERFQLARKYGTRVLSVTTTGGVHFPDYLPSVDAAITLMYPGQYFAPALAAVLAGEVSPGGKLTNTLPDLEKDGFHIQSPIGRFNEGLIYNRTKGECAATSLFITSHRNVNLEDRDGVVGLNADKQGWQEWTFELSPKGKYFITSYRNQNLEDRYGSLSLSDDKQGWQEWTLERAPSGKYFITSHQGQHLEDRDGAVGLSYDKGGWQEWTIVDAKGLPPCEGSPRPTLRPPAYLWNSLSHSPTDIVQYGSVESQYAEKDLIGYKYYEKNRMEPMFPFGFGMSYAHYTIKPSFKHCRSMAHCSVSVNVKRRSSTKDRFEGIASEVLQVYVGFEARFEDPERPVKSLAAFRKVWSTGKYSMRLKPSTFLSQWDPDKQRWYSPCEHHTSGSYRIYVGTSSADIKQTKVLRC